jgi:Holliday junction resolvase RusA-like endonuclease
LEIEFPIEFLVRGTPVSQQAARSESREQWKARVKEASSTALPQPHFASQERLSVTLYYFPAEPMAGDVDNIVKLILDACSRHVYVDDSQIERVVVQKFEPASVFAFKQATPTLAEAISTEKPVLYVRISNDPFEGLA